jgi:hypothetical protein
MGVRPALALLAPFALLPAHEIAVEQLELRARIEPVAREVTGTIGTAVKLPVGSIPVSGRGRVRYRCDGTFDGAVRYGWLVRLAARLKHVELVTRIGGEIDDDGQWRCGLAADTLVGHFEVRDTLLTGWVRSGADSIPLQGGIVQRADTAWSARISRSDDSARFAMRIDFASR